MENGFYKCTDPNTSTSDWMRLNFDSVQTEVIQKAVDCEYDLLERLDKCNECGGTGKDPDFTDFGGDDEPEECGHCEGTGIPSPHEMYGWPAAWGTMWQADDNKDLIEALDAAGFVVYRPYNLGFDGIIFGVDGGGYDFYSAHWIPLRAYLAINVCGAGNLGPDAAFRRKEILTALEKEADSNVSNGGKDFLRRFGKHYSKRRLANAGDARPDS